jgi:phosphoribosylformylglycinamidine (FGAM) synthase-like enzyme
MVAVAVVAAPQVQRATAQPTAAAMAHVEAVRAAAAKAVARVVARLRDAAVLAAATTTTTMTRNPHAPTPTWAPIRATAIQATATPDIRPAVSLTPCAPAWTA